MKTVTNLTTILLAIAATGCANLNRSLVFSTGTTIGLETALSTQSESPVKIVIGYKRAEVLFDPIMDDADGPGKAKYEIMPKAHSVLAKLQGSLSTKANTTEATGANAGFNVAQWFASGTAAEIIAENGGAAALTDNPAVANAVARAATLASSTGQIPDIIFSLSNQIFQEIKNVRGNPSNYSAEVRTQADRLFNSLNSAALVSEVPANYTIYVAAAPLVPPPAANTIYFRRVQRPGPAGAAFEKVLSYQADLASSVEELNRLRDAILKGTTIIKDITTGAEVSADETAKDKLLISYDSQKADLIAWQHAFVNDPQVVAMWRFLGGN